MRHVNFILAIVAIVVISVTAAGWIINKTREENRRLWAYCDTNFPGRFPRIERGRIVCVDPIGAPR